MRELFSSAKDVLLEACEENGNTPIQEVVGCISSGHKVTEPTLSRIIESSY